MKSLGFVLLGAAAAALAAFPAWSMHLTAVSDPLPASAWLLGSGMVGLLVIRKRERRA